MAVGLEADYMKKSLDNLTNSLDHRPTSILSFHFDLLHALTTRTIDHSHEFESMARDYERIEEYLK